MHVLELPSLADGAALAVEQAQTVTSPQGAEVDLHAFPDTTPYDERAPANELHAIGGLEQDGIRRLQVAQFVVGLELVTPSGSPSADVFFITELADTIARAGDGIVRDIDAQRMFLPGGWRVDDPLGEVDPREHIGIHLVTDEGGPAWIHTHGLIKFGCPEIEVRDVPPDLKQHVSIGMLDIAAYVLGGAVIEPGHTLGNPETPIQVREGGGDEEHWEDTPVLELTGEAGMRAWFIP